MTRYWIAIATLCVGSIAACKPAAEEPAAEEPATQAKTPPAKDESATETTIPEDLDLVILNGRVMDPETELDAVRNVGIKDGMIVVVTEQAIEGAETIDAKDHVVAPGFIDTHSHGQDPFAYKLYLRDGVTTPLELEVGAYPVEDFYDYWDGKAQANYGASVGHVLARVAVLDGVDPEGRGLYTGAIGKSLHDGAKWNTKLYDPADEPKLMEAMEEGFKQGGLGIGYPIGYYSKVGSPEVMHLTAMAKKYKSFITTHVRFLAQTPPSGYLGLEEMLTVARMQDVPLLVHHVPSNCLGLTKECLDLIDEARALGQNVVGEFYPYTFASTIAGADYLAPGFEDRTGMKPSDLVLVSTREKMTSASFAKQRKNDPSATILMYSMKEPEMMEALKRPGVWVGSDAMPFVMPKGQDYSWDTPYGTGSGHPRGSGTHARVLRIVRETQAISLLDAVAKLSYLPAKWMEPMVPQFKTRGRIQEVMTADIAIFDPETVTDNASWEDGKNTLPSTGIPYVIVNGTVVVKDSKVLEGVYPGQAIRNPVVP